MIQNLFSTQIWHSSLNIKNSIKNKVLRDIEENFQKNKSRICPFKNCSVNSNFKESEKNDINYSEIIPYFKEEYEKFCTQINLKLHKYNIDKIWYNYYLSGSNQEYHDHIGPLVQTIYSMVYFIKLNDNHPKITFHNYTNYHVLYSIKTEIRKLYSKHDINHSITRSSWDSNVKEGDLIIFPSYLPHGVFLQKTDDPRITISSNIIML